MTSSCQSVFRENKAVLGKFQVFDDSLSRLWSQGDSNWRLHYSVTFSFFYPSAYHIYLSLSFTVSPSPFQSRKVTQAHFYLCLPQIYTLPDTSYNTFSYFPLFDLCSYNSEKKVSLNKKISCCCMHLLYGLMRNRVCRRYNYWVLTFVYDIFAFHWTFKSSISCGVL